MMIVIVGFILGIFIGGVSVFVVVFCDSYLKDM